MPTTMTIAAAAAAEDEGERRSISRDSFLRIGFLDIAVRPSSVSRTVGRSVEGIVQNAVR